MMAVDPGVVGVEVPLFPALRIGSDPVLTKRNENRSVSKFSPETSLFPSTVRTYNSSNF